VVDARGGQFAQVGEQLVRTRLVLTERGRSLEGVIAAETDKLTERALATFGPSERETVIRALTAIRQLREAMISYRALFEDLTGLRNGNAQPDRNRTADTPR
jgi:hypothetical protein